MHTWWWHRLDEQGFIFDDEIQFPIEGLFIICQHTSHNPWMHFRENIEPKEENSHQISRRQPAINRQTIVHLPHYKINTTTTDR